MITLNNISVDPVELAYTTCSSLVSTFKERGFAVIENAINFDLNNIEYSGNAVEKNFIKSTIEFINFERYIKTTGLYNQLCNLGNLELINMVYRFRKNKTGTKLHTDKYSLAHCMFYANFINCWSPLTNLSLEEGPLCFVVYENTPKYAKEEMGVFMYNKQYISEKYKSNLNCIFDDYNLFENGLKSRVYDEKFLEEYNCKIYAMPLKRGDVLVFNKNIIHGALDSNTGVRKSIDFRFGINLPKRIQAVVDFFNSSNEHKLTMDSSNREVFDYQIMELMK